MFTHQVVPQPATVIVFLSTVCTNLCLPTVIVSTFYVGVKLPYTFVTLTTDLAVERGFFMHLDAMVTQGVRGSKAFPAVLAIVEEDAKVDHVDMPQEIRLGGIPFPTPVTLLLEFRVHFYFVHLQGDFKYSLTTYFTLHFGFR